ncbi:MAG: B12-binding domain-containing radical SAM protein [Halanaerobiales bacterium]|nr:B12-binding domain-containing radical SAM protein [Halanaerobiales bacterium]
MKLLLTTLNSKYIHSNLAIRYLRSYCHDLPLDIELVEFNINQNMDYILAEIYKKKSDLVAFSCYIWNITQILELCKDLKKVSPEMKIILGGPEVSFDSEVILKDNPAIDYIIQGEGEEIFYDLMETLLSGNEVDQISGLTFRRGDEIVAGPARPLITNLDRIPSPFMENLDEFENKLVYYESCRGCPFNCQYCLSSTLKGVRTFSMERIQSDLLQLIKAGVKKVKFVDRTFNFNPEHALKVMRFLIDACAQHQSKTTFHFEMTAQLINEKMLELFKQAPTGLFQFEIGVQSTNKPTLERIQRGDYFNQLASVVQKISEQGNIHLHLDLIAGLPEENYKQFQKSFNDVYRLRPDDLQLGFLKLLKGSGIRQKAEEYGYKYRELPPYEVLENNDIRFEEILELKMIEDLLEIFSNSHKFELSIDFIITRFYSENPFVFFKELKEYWIGIGYHHRPHKDEALYHFLLRFYLDKVKEDVEMFKEYLKFDFLRNVRKGLLPEWLHSVIVEEYKERCYEFVKDEDQIKKYIPELAELKSKQIMRKILIEPFVFDIFECRKKGYIGKYTKAMIFILFNYEKRDPIFGYASFNQINI